MFFVVNCFFLTLGSLTSICWIADERVWNLKKYPNFETWCKNIYNNWKGQNQIMNIPFERFKSDKICSEMNYENWLNFIEAFYYQIFYWKEENWLQVALMQTIKL